MARPRFDAPNTWHHVMVQGIASRPVFEGRRDVRKFLALLAKAVRRGGIEIHAYVFMTTHLHFLARSPNGCLGHSLGRVIGDYTQWFNRTRKRRGSLFRRPFKSKRVDTMYYRRKLLAYIDGNPVWPGIVASPEHYPYGSARCYRTRRGPPWLTREWVEGEVMGARRGPYLPALYPVHVASFMSREHREWIERRFESRSSGTDDLDDLVGSTPTEIRAWMVERTLVADGTRPGQIIATPAAVRASVRAGRSEWRDWLVRRGARGQPVSPWPLVEVGLLADLCALSRRGVGQRMALPKSTVQSRLDAHREFLTGDPCYARRSAILARRAIEST